MTFDDFVFINSELLKNTGLSLYRSESYEHPYIRVEDINRSAWEDSGLRALSLLIGRQEDENQIFGDRQFDVKRARRVGFVGVHSVKEDEDAIGATLYLADGSATEKLVNRELNKLLKKYAHKGVVDTNGNIYKGYYWTDAALASGKNWHSRLGTGVRKAGNKEPGYRPKPDS
ncbi:hypothetical protein K5F93_23825 [Pseudomonas protegens]|uniref:hypothetical protein n=1 Tax=Pseudomonas protegens TaxID=380021 RepID=UPI001C8F110D|nr:hypothetical protein [Pseudomonas protegens]QZI69363.1 hypothetical protein K5F93_23825 [Pseudomonas protegens]